MSNTKQIKVGSPVTWKGEGNRVFRVTKIEGDFLVVHTGERKLASNTTLLTRWEAYELSNNGK